MSALPPKADIDHESPDVRFVPKVDILVTSRQSARIESERDQILFVILGFEFFLQCIDGLAHGLGRDMDQSSESLFQFKDHSDRAGYSNGAKVSM